MRYLHFAVLAAVACAGGAKPETVADPARGLRSLNPDDPDVVAIATAAAASLQSGSSARTIGNMEPMFAGVYVNGRKAQKATDAVLRVTGMHPVSSTRSPTVSCTAVSSSGKSMPVACPRDVIAQLPPAYMFDEVRATADSAYVGFSETSDRAQQASCITLRRTATDWRFVSTSPIASARNCGK
jgi:hypothetical protein